MAKVPITDLPIHVYSCLTDPARGCIATIGSLPIHFRGRTPLRAKMAADEWRHSQVERHEKSVRSRAARRAAQSEQGNEASA